MKLYIANVRKFNSSDWTIKFLIKDQMNINDDDLPIAIPLVSHVSEPLIDSRVLIIRFNNLADEFGWLPLNLNNYSGIRFKNIDIDISSGDSLIITKYDNYTSNNGVYSPNNEVSVIKMDDNGIKLSNKKGSIELSASGTVSINGANLTIDP